MAERKSVNMLVKELKENDENWEWYPTTFEIVDCVAKWIATHGEMTHGILDIGCGNGGFFEKLDRTNHFNGDTYETRTNLVRHYTKYGIEKSYILAEQLPEDVILIGSDFLTQTLIDKKVDCIFCNPPYSQYETWAEKIIREGNAEKIVLVIPNRWQHNEQIKSALQDRKYTAEVIGTFDFSNAERKARATVDVVAILPESSEYAGRRYGNKPTDPFDLWFDTTFKLNADKTKADEWKEKEQRKDEIIASGDTAENLVKFYNADMQKLYDNYRALENLDADIFKELKVDVNMLKKSLRERLSNLKILYWDLLFKKYDKITSRLTTAGRDKVIKRLNDNTAIDFTLENIFQLTMWIIRHSNTLFDEQLTDYFFTLARSENINRYKSNLRWNDSDWKYMKDKCCEYGSFRVDKAKKILKNIMLDYRIIVTGWRNFEDDWRCKMSDSCRQFLYDTSVIGENLGFDLDFSIPDPYSEIDVSDWSNFDIKTKDGRLFANVKLYKNGKRHVKFCKEFMQKLNVEMARINGWIHSKEEAAEEMEMNEAEISRAWNNNLKIGIGEGTKLLGLPQAV